jgi:hypothetical protein
MENLDLKPTNETPHVICDVKGEITMTGRSLPENPAKFYQPLFEWAQNFENDSILINFRLEYFNTASSKQIFTFIKLFMENENVKKVQVKWNYEEGDYDSKETGEHFSHLFKIPFEFIEYAETESK